MNKPGKTTAMISSTALDLPEHRKQVIEACIKAGVFPIGMEHLPARDVTGVRASLEMVDQADIYIGIFAWRYGWVPDFDNPGKISITEMEFNRALERKGSGDLKELLIFLVHDEPPMDDKEMDAIAQEKLKKFKERASAGRVCGNFKSSEELHGKIFHSISEARLRIEGQFPPERLVPKPPAFYAEPDYIGSHPFIGRQSELKVLSDWALPTDPTSVLLFEAIGGNGKSILTWEWTNNNATKVRSDWAGRFWYSFYERGAVMADFCQRALAYMTGQPLEELQKKKTAELKDLLLAQLHARPWLFILDGLERVLVAYHRIDAAEVADEEANRPTDKIVNRNPCDAIRDEDNDLLRALATATPSKILVSSRLTPRVLLNAAGLPIPGVRPIVLPGLEESDAEELFRLCGITGDSAAIRHYLKTNCDNHPLVIGVLAGLINDYLPDRGNFDAWSVDSDGGVHLNLASLDLIQRRNDILRAALVALSKESAQLLSTLALLSESVDFDTLTAFNPHLPTEPAEVKEPEPVEPLPLIKRWLDRNATKRWKQYEAAHTRWQDYEKAVKARLESPEYLAAPKELEGTVLDLERRGLLQYDRRTKWYDLHPVVRGVAAGAMKADDKESYGQRVVDHFSAKPHNPYKKAEKLEDLQSGLNVVRTLLKLGRFKEAASSYRGDLSLALRVHLEAHIENLALLRPFFPSGWGELPKGLGELDACDLANEAALVLGYCGEFEAALAAYNAVLPLDLQRRDWSNVNLMVRNISRSLGDSNLGMLAKVLRVDTLALELASVQSAKQDLFMSRLRLFQHQSQIGQWAAAEEIWRLLDPMGRDWSRRSYRQGDAEWYFALTKYWQGNLQEEHLIGAATLAEQDNNRTTLRDLQRLRGRWRLEQHDWQCAITSFQEALRMARERRLLDAESETGLALAKFQLGQLVGDNAYIEAERLAQLRDPAHRLLAKLWLVIGNCEEARKHSLAAYKWAWADGEPYVNRYELTKTTELLQKMNVSIPNLPPYDPAKDKPFPWEADVRAAIEKLRADKEAEKAKQN